MHRLGPDGSIGERTDLVRHDRHGDHPRQAGAHPHMVRAVDDGVLVIDLGGDAIYQYRLRDDGTLEQTRRHRRAARLGPAARDAGSATGTT